MSMIVQIGKYGDCINILPFAYMLSKKIGRVNWLIGRPWASLLEGVSYVNPIIWEGTDDELPKALQQYRGHQMWVTQSWKNPDTIRQTTSFAKEQWRYAGALDERCKWPLVFDQRNPEREAELLRKHIQGVEHPVVLVGTTSVSTPYRHASRLLKVLKYELPSATVIGLDEIKAERLYDLIALYDAADLLVTVDTCHLHLARASQCPVIALINDLPILGAPWWNGGIAPPQTIAAWGYNELGDDLSPVIAAARNQLARKIDSIAVVCNTYSKGHTDRHKRAMMTHPHGTIYADFEHRPTLKELLVRGLNEHKDAIIYTNDDVTFPDGCLIGSTLIWTKEGNKRIDKIKSGDLCLTRNGWKQVRWAAQTGVKKTITRFGLTGTPYHLILTNEGWIPLAMVGKQHTIMVCNNQLLSMGVNIDDTRLQDMFIASSTESKKTRENPCIGMFGNIITAPSLKEFKFTTRTRTREIMTSQTWNACHSANIPTGTERIDAAPIVAEHSEFGSSYLEQSVSSVLSEEGTFEDTNREFKKANCNVRGATKYFSMSAAFLDILLDFVPVSAHTSRQCKDNENAEPVYDISVKDQHEFFANGILVHNSLDKIRRHLIKFDFGCSRRPRNPIHCGRDVFWFKDDFLRRNWEDMPNPYWSVQKPDLILCRWMRHLKGIPTTLENLNYDFPPVEVPDVITHENHISAWSNPEIENSSEGLFNEQLWKQGV